MLSTPHNLSLFFTQLFKSHNAPHVTRLDSKAQAAQLADPEK
jgi:hypothetical protein